MAALHAALEATTAGNGRLVLLVGEPGIGKTRTAFEFAETRVGPVPACCGAAVTTASGH